jgi:trans-aconitate methyltransferase
MMVDPMFKELPQFFGEDLNLKTVMDIGTGFGVPACWIVERFPKAKVFGIDPDGERIRVASAVLGERGLMKQDAAPHIPSVPVPADAAVMLDMIHYLPDDALALTLKRLHTNLSHGGRLLIRVAVPNGNSRSWLWKLETIKSRLSRIPLYNRSIDEIVEMLSSAGFQLKHNTPSGLKGESVWLMAENCC